MRVVLRSQKYDDEFYIIMEPARVFISYTYMLYGNVRVKCALMDTVLIWPDGVDIWS